MDWLSYIGFALIGGAGAAYFYLNHKPSKPQHTPVPVSAAVQKIYGDKFLILSADELIAELDLQPSIANIKANLALSNENWNRDGLPLLRNFIVFVQRLPASESHHHAGDGGLVKHTLDVAALALLASSSRSWPPNAKTEDIARLTAVWRYGILTAALLHDIGKTLTSFDIELYDKADSRKFSLWMPDTGNMDESGKKLYRVTFPDHKAAYEAHAALGWTFFQSIVPSNARKWMNEADPNLIKALRSYLSGQHQDSPLTDIIKQADMTSTARDLRHGSRQRFASAKRPPLIETVMDTLRTMLAERGAHFSIASTAGGDIFRKDDLVFMMAKNVPDYIRTYLGKNKHPAAASFPSDNQRIFDTLLEYGAVLPNPKDNHKAVTPVAVSFERMDGAVKSHLFTMLCFKLDTLYPDGQYPHEFQGMLEVCPDAVLQMHEPAPEDAVSLKNEPGSMNETAFTSIEKGEEIDNIPPPPARKMDFMAVQEDIPKQEKEINPAPVSPPEREVQIPPSPQTKPKAKSGIDALLSLHNLLDEDDTDTSSDTPPNEQESPSPAEQQKQLNLTEQATTPSEAQTTSGLPPAKQQGKQSKKKAMSVLDSLFSDFNGQSTEKIDSSSANDIKPDIQDKPVFPQQNVPQYLSSEDTAAAALNEIQDERQSLPTRSPRPVTVHKQSNILEQQPAIHKKATDLLDGQKQALKDEGKRFWNWLANGLTEGSITVNQSGSPVHFVEQGMLLVTPAIFREYAGGVFDKNNPSCPGLLAQKGFTALGLHGRTKRSAIYTALAVKAQQKLLFHCYLIPEDKLHLIVKADSRPPNNIDIALADSQNLLQPKPTGEDS
ncbi:MobH family relaxase [Neisseria sp. S1]|uniref:MobH family relaxase n=1 Tax=Neisseria sp. S1 TaxID=3318354 RepID=UPI003A896744